MTTVPTNLANTHDVAVIADAPTATWVRSWWAPIMMGAVCAIALQFTFTVLGIAIGATVGDEVQGVDGAPVRTMGLAAGLWWLITGTIAIAVGAIILGRASGLPRSPGLKIQAASMWAIIAIFGFLVVWSGAGMLSQAATPIGTLVSTSLDPNAMRGGAGSAMRSMDGSTFSSPSGASANAMSKEDARDATQAAAWWAVIGMVIGVVTSIMAASAVAPGHNRTATRHS